MELVNILVQKEIPIATVTVNRPEVLNALDQQTLQELECVFYEIKEDPNTKVIILTGAGEKSFVAGADITYITTMDASQGVQFAHKGQAILDLIENLGKPVIAAINGYALGGGLELAMACTCRLAAKKAKLGQPEINLGVIPGFGGTQRLSRLVGEGRSMELVLLGEPLDAQRAYEIGLVNRVVDSDQLMATAKSWAEKLCGKSAVIMKYAMESVHRGLQISLQEGLNLEANLFGLCCATDDKKEGTRAFLEKRKPHFQDR